MKIKCSKGICKYFIEELSVNNKLSHFCTYEKRFSITKHKRLQVGEVNTVLQCPLLKKCYSKANIYDLHYLEKFYRFERGIAHRNGTYFLNKTELDVIRKNKVKEILDYLYNLDIKNFSFKYDDNSLKFTIYYNTKIFYYFLVSRIAASNFNYEFLRYKKFKRFLKQLVFEYREEV